VAKTLREWIDTDVAPVRSRPVRWLSENHFFRDPIRPVHCDTSYFFSPADGIIIYQKTVRPDEELIEIKGRMLTLRDAMRSPRYRRESLVIGVFMTFYDVHVNRIPFPGRLSWQELDPIDTCNLPMLELEKDLLEALQPRLENAEYLHNNQRMLNRVFAPDLGECYYLLQIADFDVDSIIPFRTRQNLPCDQNQRFSQIRFGSQVDLIVPLSRRYAIEPTQSVGVHVEAGIDTLIRITRRSGEER
jgi:phosphatidylserine decarboxylase